MDGNSRGLETELASVLGRVPEAWHAEPLTHNPGNAVTASIWRIVADGFSAVVKVVSGSRVTVPHWASSEDPTHFNYWRREALVYEHDLVAEWTGTGLRAPRLLALVHRDDGDIAMWLEDVTSAPGFLWSVGRLVPVARALGRAHARPAPEHDWLSRGYLRRYIESKPYDFDLLEDDAAWSKPLVRDHFPPGLRAEMIRLHRDREAFLSILDRLPRAWCHLDFWPNNIIRATDGSTVVVDWGFTGDGAVGEDIGNLIPDSVFDLHLPSTALAALDRRLVGAYIDGLGGHVDPRLVRLAVCASSVKYDWLTPLMLDMADKEQRDYGGERPVDAARRYRERGATLLFLAGWADEARRLADQLL